MFADISARCTNSGFSFLEWLIQAMVLCFIILGLCARNTDASESLSCHPPARKQGNLEKQHEGPGQVYALGRLHRWGKENQTNFVKLMLEDSKTDSQQSRGLFCVFCRDLLVPRTGQDQCYEAVKASLSLVFQSGSWQSWPCPRASAEPNCPLRLVLFCFVICCFLKKKPGTFTQSGCYFYGTNKP